MTLNGTGNCAQIAFEKLANCHWTASSVECCFQRSRTSFLFRLIKESQTLPPLCFYTLIKRERFGGSVPCRVNLHLAKSNTIYFRCIDMFAKTNKQTDGQTDRCAHVFVVRRRKPQIKRPSSKQRDFKSSLLGDFFVCSFGRNPK